MRRLWATERARVRYGGRLMAVQVRRSVSYFPAKTAPETIMVPADKASEAHKILDPLPCDLAAKYQAAKEARGGK